MAALEIGDKQLIDTDERLRLSKIVDHMIDMAQKTGKTANKRKDKTT